MIVTDAPKTYRFAFEAYSQEEFTHLWEMLSWIKENACTNGRVHFYIDGGVYSDGCFCTGEVVFTNDENGSDATHFKLRWVKND